MKKFWIGLLMGFGCMLYAPAQTTSGLITGVVTDSTGAFVPDVQITLTNVATQIVRDTTSGSTGTYIVPDLPPGNYTLKASKAGFATVVQEKIVLLVNGSVTVNVRLGVAAQAQTIEVTTAPPMLNTTSSTLGEVVEHQETVDLPLNGREFTQLALLSPGAAPQEGGQQSTYTVSLGAGGISPAVSGQRADQNNFTMDGVLNNNIYFNVWSISPPPDAIAEFNVQSHITDAQFAISSGANINVVTRSGTNQFHGDFWEFLRNDDLDAQTYPATSRLTYRQNQYGLYLGGPIIRNNTWFSGYWEGYRFSQAVASLGDTLTTNEAAGNFSGEEGTTQIGTDSLGRPEYANEIYDPTTSRPDPANPGKFLRDPFPNNSFTPNPASAAFAAKYFPAPNLNVPEGQLPNFVSTIPAVTKSDVFGFRLDRQFTANDTAFARFNRSKATAESPVFLNVLVGSNSNYAESYALGYTHLFNANTILDFRAQYSWQNDNNQDAQSDPALITAMGMNAQLPPVDGVSLPPYILMGNGYAPIWNLAYPFGPIENMDYHLDFSKVAGNHTWGVGGMYYHIRAYDSSIGTGASFSAAGTAQDGDPSNNTGFSPASLMLGTLDSYTTTQGFTSADQTVSWYGLYAQDQWKATRKLVLTAGIRWDYVTPPNYHRIESGLDMFTGQVCITGTVLPTFPAATCPSGYYYPQYDGWEPRLGVTYQALNRTVIHSALAMLDDHNNTLMQENQNIRLSWPDAGSASYSGLDLGSVSSGPNFSGPAGAAGSLWTDMPSAPSLLGGEFTLGYGSNPHNKIPYSVEYNFGVQQQLQKQMVLKVDYVGSFSRHQYIYMEANEAVGPGPGSIQSRAEYPQYGPFYDSDNIANANYNALQVEFNKDMSNGLSFKTSYTWSKSLDEMSDPYDPGPVDFYNIRPDWGPSDYNRPQMFVFSGLYQLPVGRSRQFLNGANAFTDNVLGGWNIGTIITLDSGAPFDVYANGDPLNTGWSYERAQRTGQNPYMSSGGGGSGQLRQWLNPAAFTQPGSTVRGNESRNDLHDPSYKDLDFNATKNFPLYENYKLVFKAEMFNLFNHTNYGTPANTVNSSGFGVISSSNGDGRVVQFALKLNF